MYFSVAKKGQKFINYTEEEKEEILQKYINGISGYYLAKEYGLPVSTIKTWTSKLNHPELYPNQGQKRGRPKEKELTKEDYKERYEILKKYQAFLKAQREKR